MKISPPNVIALIYTEFPYWGLKPLLKAKTIQNFSTSIFQQEQIGPHGITAYIKRMRCATPNFQGQYFTDFPPSYIYKFNPDFSTLLTFNLEN